MFSKTTDARGVAAAACLLAAGVAAFPIAATAQMEEILVTTRKREESLQDVPIAVSAISSEQIEREGIRDLKDAVQNQPSVQFDQSFGPSDNRITIRGLSNTRGRSNVAFLVDGIDVTTENLISAGSGLLANRRLLNDVERIEIVKGPQSALFGRAAFAGAIAYVTKEPGDEFGGNVAVDLGDYGRREYDGAIGGPVNDQFGLRLSGTKWNEEGYYTNSVSGNNVGGSNGWGMALTGVWKPEDNVKIKGRVEYSDEHDDPRAVANVQGTTPFYLPDSAKAIVQPIITGNPLTQKAGSSGTNLFNFGTYCPKYGYDPGNIQGAPGFCLPALISSTKGMQVTQSENFQTGGDYPGTDLRTFRAEIIASMEVAYGTITSSTGWIDFNGTDAYDQDYQAIGRPDKILSQNQSDQESRTHQLSQELRFSSNLDGPVQYTVGALYWDEHRSLQDRNWIISCAPYGRVGAQPLVINGQTVLYVPPGGDPNNPQPVLDPTTGTLQYVSGLCDGAPGVNDNPGTPTYNQQVPTLTSWQAYASQIQQPMTAGQWEAWTQSWSFYGNVEWEIAEDWKVTLENRYVHEDFHLTKPAATDCTEIAFAQGVNPTAPWVTSSRVYCDIERVLLNLQPPPLDASTGQLAWRQLEGSTYSNFNTPKVTLAWQATDQINTFFSWAFAEKPGGINQLVSGGGSAPPGLESERFAPEKMKAWELGIKSNFEAGGLWRVNASGFFQDYTDKQVTIQIVDEAGVAQPRVTNASGAQVWGFEFESTWQPNFMDGLTLQLSGTILDPKYTDWVDDSRNLVKAARYGDCPLVWKLEGSNGQVQETQDPNNPIAHNPNSAVFCRFDYSNNTLERTPKQAYAASATLQRPFWDTPFDYLIQVSGSYEGKRWLEPENLVQVDEHALMDVRLGLTSDQWEIIGYVDNVLDSDTALTGGSGPDFGEQVTQLGFTAGFGTSHYFVTLPDPREFGIRGIYRFGGGR